MFDLVRAVEGVEGLTHKDKPFALCLPTLCLPTLCLRARSLSQVSWSAQRGRVAQQTGLSKQGLTLQAGGEARCYELARGWAYQGLGLPGGPKVEMGNPLTEVMRSPIKKYG